MIDMLKALTQKVRLLGKMEALADTLCLIAQPLEGTQLT